MVVFKSNNMKVNNAILTGGNIKNRDDDIEINPDLSPFKNIFQT